MVDEVGVLVADLEYQKQGFASTAEPLSTPEDLIK